MVERTLLVHPHGLLRCALRELLSVYGLTEEVSTSLTTEEAINNIPAFAPDLVVFCDTGVANSTTDELRRIRQRHSELPILVIGEKDHPMLVRQWLDAGANGFVTTSHDVEELRKAFAALAAKENYVPGSLARAMVFDDNTPTGSTALASLSKRELQVLVQVVEGRSIQEISARLCISPKTVGTYRHRLFRKLNLRNDAELTQLAITQGLTNLPTGAPQSTALESNASEPHRDISFPTFLRNSPTAGSA